jgi:hypothetical protein
MTAEQIVEALAIPQKAKVARRIPKSTLIERGAMTATDRRLIDRLVERIDWLGTLSPSTAGVAPSTDPDRPVAEIQVLALYTKAEPLQRLLEVVHRAIPYPLVLIVQAPSEKSKISLASLRPAERISDQLVVERVVATPELEAGDTAFLKSLRFETLPRLDLRRLYDGLIERGEALVASRISKQPFRLPANAAEAESRRQALAEYQSKESEWIAARAAARKEKRLAQQVQISEQARLLGEELAATAASLA